MLSAILIGVDLGPNLSVTGSLATILWLIVLRREGEHVGAMQFLKARAGRDAAGAAVVARGAFDRCTLVRDDGFDGSRYRYSANIRIRKKWNLVVSRQCVSNCPENFRQACGLGSDAVPAIARVRK